MITLDHGKGIVVGFEKWDLKDYPDLQVVGCNATSCEHLPLKELEERGIKVISLKGEKRFLSEITSTAEHTVGLIIALLRKYKVALNGPYRDREEYEGNTLSEKAIGIIGYGRIGRMVADYADALGMVVLVSDFAEGAERVMADADVVTFHIPLEKNEGFVTKEKLALMKPTAIVINTSRSGIFEEGALQWALQNKVIAGAAIDFIDDEGLVEYARTHDNLILTNHIGGNTTEDLQKTEQFITNKVINFLQKNGRVSNS